MVALTLLLIGGSAGYFWYVVLGPGRYREAERFTEQLAAIPGVGRVEVHGHEDLGYDIHGFTLEVEGHGPLMLGELSQPDSDRLEKLHINRIGDQLVTYVVEGELGTYQQSTRKPMRSKGGGSGFTVGKEGAHAGLFPFPLHSVSDVVEHYDEICEVISTWPRQPEYAQLVDGEGVRWFYALADSSLDSNWLNPTELETE